MTISFSKSPDYGNTLDNISVDIRIDGEKEIHALDAVEAFISFMIASGYSKEAVTISFEELLLED